MKLSKQDIAGYSINKKHFHCALDRSLVSTNSSCIIAIFNNNKQKVNSLCDFRFFLNIVTPHIKKMNPSTAMVYKMPQRNMNCNGKQIIKPGCHFCILMPIFRFIK